MPRARLNSPGAQSTSKRCRTLIPRFQTATSPVSARTRNTYVTPHRSNLSDPIGSLRLDLCLLSSFEIRSLAVRLSPRIFHFKAAETEYARLFSVYINSGSRSSLGIVIFCMTTFYSHQTASSIANRSAPVRCWNRLCRRLHRVLRHHRVYTI